MKKVLLGAMLLAGTTLGFAEDLKETSKNNKIEIKTNSRKNKKVTEYKFVRKGILTTCYERECWVGSKDNGNGTISQVMVCGDWKEMPCPKPEVPQKPAITM